MGHDLLVFVPLAVFTNTALGPPFDPVLLWFAGRHPFPEAWTLILLGSVCAGLGGALEATAVKLGTGMWARILPRAGVVRGSGGPLLRWFRYDPCAPPGRFYAFAFAMAASPAPFSLVRIAALSRRPAPIPYALVIAAGRVPRYALLVFAWNSLEPPAWAATALVTLVAAAGLAAWALRRHVRPHPQENARPENVCKSLT